MMPMLPSHVETLFHYLSLEPDEVLTGVESDNGFVTAAFVALLWYRVIPVRAGSKIPRITQWPVRASTNLKQLLQWERQFSPDWSILTGRKNNLVVLDIDGDEGFADLLALEKDLGPLPTTVAVESGRQSGGRHLWFALPPGADDPRTMSHVFGTAIDVRGWHGHAILPGSIHKSGNKYRWAEGVSLYDMAPAVLPAAWFDALPKHVEQASIKGRATRLSMQPRVVAPTRNSSMIIGDGKGCGGFNSPIYRLAVRYFFLVGAQADAGPIREFLVQAILAAPRGHHRTQADIQRYSSVTFLNKQIENARRYVLRAGDPNV